MANSSFVRKRIEKYYRREATVIHPPVAAGNFSLAPATGDYYLAVGQLVRYKRFDLAVAALTALGRRLIVAGTGEEEKRLRKIAGPNVEFVGWQTDEKLAELMSNCRALVFPGEEDFGIIPVEAMAAGRPVIAYGSGGVLETVLDNKTGPVLRQSVGRIPFLRDPALRGNRRPLRSRGNPQARAHLRHGRVPSQVLGFRPVVIGLAAGDRRMMRRVVRTALREAP